MQDYRMYNLRRGQEKNPSLKWQYKKYTQKTKPYNVITKQNQISLGTKLLLTLLVLLSIPEIMRVAASNNHVNTSLSVMNYSLANQRSSIIQTPMDMFAASMLILKNINLKLQKNEQLRIRALSHLSCQRLPNRSAMSFFAI